MEKKENRRDMKVLDLVLKGVWYDMIASGEKREEYRECKAYWVKRLTELGTDYVPFSYRYGYEEIPFKGYTHVRFRRGYTNDSMLFEIDGMGFGVGNSSWGAPDEEVFIIRIGKEVVQ